MSTHTAHVAEIFSSIQGEGIYAGKPQVFVRFCGCDLSCQFCDTQSARGAEKPFCSVEKTPGLGDFAFMQNPLEASDVVEAVDMLSPPRDVCVTGGEPLLHVDFLMRLLPALRSKGHRIHLETNGTRPDEVARLSGHIDVAAMDFKLPSATKCEDMFELHARFLKATTGAKVFAKAVVTADVKNEEIIRCGEIIAASGKSVPLIIQPVSAGEVEMTPPSLARLLEIHRIASNYIDDVRVLPQYHKLAGVR